MKFALAAAAILAASAVQAQAHVTAEPREAAAGATQEVRFRVGHGCHDTAATTALRVEMPPGLASARPQPKPGWTLAIAHRPDGTAGAITWTGSLPGDQFDDFAVLVRLPATEGPIYFPAVQTCGAEEERWTDIPAAGAGAPSHPAPSLRLGPAAPDGGHHH
ncbi:YcnI family protein [Phenylobacterium sp.]|uniref:YcnI family copper-binding membrane protein n=1 Tax=Phenylobacterium sp. TaxID=1871053 RepID=UPI0012159038|nr:YcnI family protein [Phenylobacterium sp.]THD60442.1 MAG: DUF1775 domain-containing protein [Phenylobacterium sp.]